MKKLYAAFVFLCLTVTAHAQDSLIKNGKAASSDTLTLKWENDLFAGTDKWYTNGMQVAWTLADVRTWDTPLSSEDWAQDRFSSKLPSWAQFLVSTLPFSEDYENNLYRVSFNIGQNMYTPENIDIATPQPTQRPWAGWLYLAPSFIVQGENRMDVFELSFGVVGSYSGAEAAQKFIHKDLLGGHEPMGWSNQLANEFAFNLSWQRYWRFVLTEETKRTFGADFVGNAGFTAGNVYVYGNAGFMLRAGYNIPHDYGTSLIRSAGTYANPVDDGDPRLSDGMDLSIYGFVGTQQYIMGRNIFLQGNTFANSAS
ncbi:MAG: lipid A deacylase LpxR family protein, partial [Puniceicoccales bacterium]